MLLRARLVLPITSPPIEDGAVLIHEDRVTAVLPWSEIPPEDQSHAQDLGESVLMPGLINAHCHLDYSHMAGKIAPLKRFTDWIKAIVSFKSTWSYTDFAHSWVTGANMLLRNGTTTVADIETVPELLPDAWNATPLRVFSFRELINLKSTPTPDQLMDQARHQAASLPHDRNHFGLSPHAPYTTTSSLLRLAGQTARDQGWRLTTHISESEEEFQMSMYQAGPLFDWLKSQRDMLDCGLGSPIAQLEKCGYLSPNLLAVHVNYMDRGDADLLAKRKVSVVHCPSSHEYFQHIRFPLEELEKVGIPISLGTDSLASTLQPSRPGQSVELNLFHEMRVFARHYPDVPPSRILKFCTLNAAHGLGVPGQLGQLTPGAKADLIVIPYSGSPLQVTEAILQFPGKVAASMINGQWALPPQGLS